MPAPAHSIEGIARVVHVEDGIAWLEPEQTTSCGSCASAAACGAGATGIGTVARRLEQRRFALGDAAMPALRVGERIVVGVELCAGLGLAGRRARRAGRERHSDQAAQDEQAGDGATHGTIARA